MNAMVDEAIAALGEGGAGMTDQALERRLPWTWEPDR